MALEGAGVTSSSETVDSMLGAVVKILLVGISMALDSILGAAVTTWLVGTSVTNVSKLGAVVV